MVGTPNIWGAVQISGHMSAPSPPGMNGPPSYHDPPGCLQYICRPPADHCAPLSSTAMYTMIGPLCERFLLAGSISNINYAFVCCDHCGTTAWTNQIFCPQKGLGHVLNSCARSHRTSDRSQPHTLQSDEECFEKRLNPPITLF